MNHYHGLARTTQFWRLYNRSLHLGRAVKFRRRNLEALGDLVCGNLGSDEPGGTPRYFPYRSSMYITDFFEDLDTQWVHDGSTRHRWVADVLESMLAEPHDGPTHPPETFCRLIDQLMSPSDAINEGPSRPNALRILNDVLAREGFEAFYSDDQHASGTSARAPYQRLQLILTGHSALRRSNVERSYLHI